MNLKGKAETIIRNNSRGDFTIPCSTLYPFQWNWDSAFCALGIFTYDKERALKEIDKLFEGQWDNGMIPHIIFHQEDDNYYPGPKIWESNTTPLTSCISQPPVLATVIWFMAIHGLSDKEVLNKYFDKLMNYHTWFVQNRDPYNKGLLSIIHPWESGRDNSPDWDDALNAIPIQPDLDIQRKDNNSMDDDVRPTNDDYNRYMQIVFRNKEFNWDSKKIYDKGLFNVCDPGIQFIFIRACKDLYKLAVLLEHKEHYSTIENWIEQYSENSDKLWCDQINAYTSLDMKTNKLYSGISSASMLFAYADVGDQYQKHKMLEHSKRILYFSKYGFPSYDPFSKDFNQKKYWRGPVWCIINFMLAIGFAHIREIDLAQKIKSHTIKLIEDNGFFEYYDPHLGVGYGGDNFSWTAATYLVFKNDIFM